MSAIFSSRIGNLATIWSSTLKINAEFRRITTMPLQSRLVSHIDVPSDELTKVFKKRARPIRRRLQNILEPMAQDDGDLVCECIIKGLCVYLSEDLSSLVTEHVATDEAIIQRSTEETTMGLYIIKSRDASGSPEDIGIVLEGQRVLQDLDNYFLAAAMLFGIMYTLNLTYPPELKYTFEVLQKLVTELTEGPGSQEQTVRVNSFPNFECPFF